MTRSSFLPNGFFAFCLPFFFQFLIYDLAISFSIELLHFMITVLTETQGTSTRLFIFWVAADTLWAFLRAKGHTVHTCLSLRFNRFKDIVTTDNRIFSEYDWTLRAKHDKYAVMKLALCFDFWWISFGIQLSPPFFELHRRHCFLQHDTSPAESKGLAELAVQAHHRVYCRAPAILRDSTKQLRRP